MTSYIFEVICVAILSLVIAGVVMLFSRTADFRYTFWLIFFVIIGLDVLATVIREAFAN